MAVPAENTNKALKDEIKNLEPLSKTDGKMNPPVQRLLDRKLGDLTQLVQRFVSHSGQILQHTSSCALPLKRNRLPAIDDTSPSDIDLM